MQGMKVIFLTALALVLVACGGGGGGGSSSSSTATAASTVTISGTVMFERPSFDAILGSGGGLDFNNIQTLPIRGATIQLVNNSNVVLSSTTTSSTGTYSFLTNANQIVQIRVLAATQNTVGASWDFEVRDNTNSNAIYSLAGSLSSSGTSNSVRNLTATTGFNTGTNTYTEARAAAPFAILDTVTDSINLVVTADATVSMPAADIFWSVNNVPVSGNLSAGQIGTSFYSAQQIFILGQADVDTDEFDAHVIAHEWGHYFEDNLSRSDSVGGPHSNTDILDPRVAFSEGFGNALSSITLNDPLYRDSGGLAQNNDIVLINVEANTTAQILSPTVSITPGWFNEGSVQTIIYDIFDSPSTNLSLAEPIVDPVTLGFSAIYNAMTSSVYTDQETFTTIFSLVDVIKNQNPTLATDIDTIVATQNIDTIIDSRGTNETNDGGSPVNLPPYKLISDNGIAVQVCSHIDNGEENRLGNRQFMLLDVTTPGVKNISVDLSAAPSRPNDAGSSDPDFLLFLNNEFLGGATSSTANSEVANTPALPAETHLLEVFEFGNASTTASGGNFCFDVTVS